ncbi:MAG: hypothetical protein ACI4L2_07580 [Wujia sp.]
MSLNIDSGNQMYNFMNNMLGTSAKKSGGSSLESLLGDYNAVRNGSYLKLAQKYYKTDGAKEATQKQFSTSASVKAEDKMTKASAESAWNAVSALRDDKLYAQKQTESEDAILKNVKAFVDSYNSVLDSAENSDKSNVLKDAVRLVNQTGNYSNALSKVGITIQSDNSLKLDETVFSQADMQDVKQLFAGDYSFGSNTQNRLLQMVSDASSSISNSLYTAQGTTSAAVGSIYDSLF